MATRRGDIAKQEVTNRILEAFGNDIAAVQDKKIYINVKEGAETVQIAISLTMPKAPVTAEPIGNTGGIDFSSEPATNHTPVDISPEDRAAVEALKIRLGIT